MAPMSLSPEKIVNFLRENPKFLQDNPQIYDYLLPPTTTEGVADFRAHLIARLRADKDAAQEDVRAVLTASRANMNNAQRIHALVLRLLEATGAEAFLQTLTTDALSWLDVDIAALALESGPGPVPLIPSGALRLLPPSTVEAWMDGADVLLQDHIGGIEALYGGAAPLVRSQILLRLSLPETPGILAFGSRDPHAFSQGQGTDQVLFLAGVVERCLARWV